MSAGPERQFVEKGGAVRHRGTPGPAGRFPRRQADGGPARGVGCPGRHGPALRDLGVPSASAAARSLGEKVPVFSRKNSPASTADRAPDASTGEIAGGRGMRRDGPLGWA
jgi:hypothetical protein